MPRFQILRGYPDFAVMHLEHMRDVIKRSRELLANLPVPDTFAGRKTHEPFPQDDEQTRNGERDGRTTELEPPK